MTTALGYQESGSGRPLILLHGAGEDADMLAEQAAAFAERGFHVVWYDRRGTGDSTRDDWPDGGVAQHVADAAWLVTSLGLAPAAVLGLSSGGVVALELTARHPDLVARVVAWEPAALMALPQGAEVHREMLAPIEQHLAEHPADWRGAYLVALAVISGGEVDPTDPGVARQLRNAEAAVRDDSRVITRHRLDLAGLRGREVTIAVGRDVDPLLGSIAERLAAEVGRPVLVVEAAPDHEVYLTAPEVLTTLGDPGGPLAGDPSVPPRPLR